MKRLGRVLGSLLAVALTVFSMQAFAAAQMGGRDFNHMTTGFILSGGHAVAACETCHIGGVFKGTPRACDGCHATGKRVIATPKSNTHIVTDAQCDTCHFNTATWLGARYNHGTAIQGQCRTCHNGRQAAGKPGSHNMGKKATESCDSCHRTSAWTPSSWNHTIGGSCDQAGCHLAGQNDWYKGVATAHTRIGMATYACQRCHNYVRWSPAPYDHAGASATGCETSCHNGTVAIGQTSTHYTRGTADCSECHINTTRSWTPALGGKPSNHIPYNVGVACTNCHTSATGKVAVSTLHAYSVATYTCANCHIKPNNYTGNNQETKSSHSGSSGNNCTTACHEHSKAVNYSGW